MSRSTMVNFRLRDEDIQKLDVACEASNMSRSDFIRAAVAEKVGRLDGKTQKLAAASGRGKAKPKSQGKYSDCPKNPACKFVRTPTGIQLCQTCGVKRA